MTGLDGRSSLMSEVPRHSPANRRAHQEICFYLCWSQRPPLPAERPQPLALHVAYVPPLFGVVCRRYRSTACAGHLGPTTAADVQPPSLHVGCIRSPIVRLLYRRLSLPTQDMWGQRHLNEPPPHSSDRHRYNRRPGGEFGRAGAMQPEGGGARSGAASSPST